MRTDQSETRGREFSLSQLLTEDCISPAGAVPPKLLARPDWSCRGPEWNSRSRAEQSTSKLSGRRGAERQHQGRLTQGHLPTVLSVIQLQHYRAISQPYCSTVDQNEIELFSLNKVSLFTAHAKLATSTDTELAPKTIS